MRRTLPWLVCLALLSPAAPSAADKPAPCKAAEFRQFDFWIGDWEVHAPDGSLAGTNRIDSILDGCGLQENWAGAKGLTGTSLNTYDAPRRVWHQTWIDSQGGVLLLEGALRAGSMVLSGTSPAQAGGTITDRITWSRLDGGDVRQLWEQSKDGGRTWSVGFDGRYTRKR